MELHELGITHYDLHCDNIMVEKLATPIDLSFEFLDTTHILRTDIILKLIDYNTTHLKSVTSTNFEIDDYLAYYGTMLIIFDPEYDIQTIFTCLYKAAKSHLHTTYNLLRENFLCLEDTGAHICLVGREIPTLLDINYCTHYGRLYDANLYWFDMNNEYIQSAISDKNIVIERRKNKIIDIYRALVNDLEL